jgi:hypothetical protein
MLLLLAQRVNKNNLTVIIRLVKYVGNFLAWYVGDNFLSLPL